MSGKLLSYFPLLILQNMPSNPSPRYFAGLSSSNKVFQHGAAEAPGRPVHATAGLGGSVFRTMGLPLHSTTHMEIPQ